MLPVLVARIDQLIGIQIDSVLHHSRLQQLEAAWRGLHLLVLSGAGYGKVRIKLLDIRFNEMRYDLERALDPDHSELFNKICSQEFDHPGGEPFGLLIGDYAIDPDQPTQLTTLRVFSQVAASAFVPFVCGAAPAIFDIDCFSELTLAGCNEALLQPAGRRVLQTLRDFDNSRFLALALPRIHLRQCWGQQPPFAGGIHYREHCRGIEDYLWGSAAFALATVLMREFQHTGWFTRSGALRDAFRGTFGGELGFHVPAHGPVTPNGDTTFAPLPLTDVVITDAVARQIAAQGFISLSQCWNTELGVFVNMPTLHQATCMMHMLCASRIAHHLKAMMRDKIGSHATATDCERLIDNWLRQYTSASRGTDPATQARYPLAAARVSIDEDLYVPGHYRCTLWLTLHRNNDDIESEIRLTTELIRLAA